MPGERSGLRGLLESVDRVHRPRHGGVAAADPQAWRGVPAIAPRHARGQRSVLRRGWQHGRGHDRQRRRRLRFPLQGGPRLRCLCDAPRSGCAARGQRVLENTGARRGLQRPGLRARCGVRRAADRNDQRPRVAGHAQPDAGRGQNHPPVRGRRRRARSRRHDHAGRDGVGRRLRGDRPGGRALYRATRSARRTRRRGVAENDRSGGRARVRRGPG